MRSSLYSRAACVNDVPALRDSLSCANRMFCTILSRSTGYTSRCVSGSRSCSATASCSRCPCSSSSFSSSFAFSITASSFFCSSATTSCVSGCAKNRRNEFSKSVPIAVMAAAERAAAAVGSTNLTWRRELSSRDRAMMSSVVLALVLPAHAATVLRPQPTLPRPVVGTALVPAQVRSRAFLRNYRNSSRLMRCAKHMPTLLRRYSRCAAAATILSHSTATAPLRWRTPRS